MHKLLFILFGFTPLLSNAQVLLEITSNGQHAERAGYYQQAKVKRVWYTMHSPFLLSMEVSMDKKDKSRSEWTIDTITYSTFYLKNGFIEKEMETLPGGENYYLKQYNFDTDGKFLRTTEVNSRRLRYYDYQAMDYHYVNGQLPSINKLRYKDNDTTKSITSFDYALDKLNYVIEKNDVNGDTLLSSYFTYNTKDHYTEKKSFQKEWAEVRTNYFYLLGSDGRINKYSNGLKGLPKNPRYYKTVSYNYKGEVHAGNSFFKVERFDL